MPFLISPSSLQSSLTNACRSGKERPYQVEDHEEENLDQDHSDDGDESQTNGHLRFPPPTEVPGIRGSVLLTREGHFMSRSEGLEVGKARYISGLLSSTWQTQVQAAIKVDKEAEGLSNASDVSSDGSNRAKTVVGEPEFILISHDGHLIAIVPCHVYLIGLMADSHVPLGLLKHRAVTLAKRLLPQLEKATPKGFGVAS